LIDDDSVSFEGMDRTSLNRYDPLIVDHEQQMMNIPSTEKIKSSHSNRHSLSEREELHHRFDEFLDQAQRSDVYNPDSEHERMKRRRQRPRTNSMSDDSHRRTIQSTSSAVPHTPIIAQVFERPDPSLVHLRYNPYQAGDRAHAISQLTPAEFSRQFIDADNNIPYERARTRSNPPLFFDSSALGHPQIHMRPDIDRRQHIFRDDAVYIDRISQNHPPIRTAWLDTNDQGDYRDDYIMAKQSVLNTRNILSSIQDELQQIVLPSSPSTDNYHA
jgi:hypothetical protein